MTVGDMIAWATTHVYEKADADEIADLLYRLDVRLWRDTIRPREGGETIEGPQPYRAENRGQALLLDVPDDELYRAYIEYHLCRRLGEDGRASDAGALYNELHRRWVCAWVREHPARPVCFRYRGR